MATLVDIRYLTEQDIKSDLENTDIVNWSNEVNMDIGNNIEIPSAAPANIVLTSTDLEYSLPIDLKIINRMRLQSDIDQGYDRNIELGYRIYNGEIVLPRVFWLAPDTLVVDYFKHMTYFANVTESIDIADRFTPLYKFYYLWRYYESPFALERFGAQEAKRKAEMMQAGYMNIKNQVVAYYSLGNEPVVIEGRW
ncbi:hypothetical protein PAECIP111893_02381 [Paenibacillus plantiphilus]|uniref:Uncharacterized protein n=1 Tax=Paenibacillus plantiphilus TaxID=2905650 RepID=A0ABN8GIX7_9BACL|nr:hypothetical protein [Paenibacillus plantiphilus]CAH1205624.1 hypothetical protein PAECIP111893_02381 [Paenibacillus plantiphilus]